MTPDQLRELATELRYMADVYRDWDGEKVCRAADHLLACADNQPYETERWNVERQSDGSLLVCFNRHERGEKCEYEHFVPAPAAPQPCWCHKCNEGRLVNGVPFAMTQMIVCPICGNKRCPHASDHALACTASNDPIAAPAAPLPLQNTVPLDSLLRRDERDPQRAALMAEARLAPAPAAPQAERQQVSEPTRSEQLRAAGFTARDNRIECDTCGKTFTAQFLPIHKCEPSGDWPESLMLRATKLHDDMGGLGQRIFTTAGAGYEKRKYVRADLMREPTEAQIEQEKANGSR